MPLYAFNDDGLPTYDAAGRNLILVGGNAVDLDGNAIARNVYGEPTFARWNIDWSATFGTENSISH